MKSHQKNNVQKVVLVISDLHLSAGKMIKGKRNLLEDFHYDNELIDFLNYYSAGDYFEVEVELVINGDFLDFLAVPYVEYYDDEFWSESAAMAKLRLIMKAHRGVLEALKTFLTRPLKKIVYIIGNHDAEFVFESLKAEFLSFFGEHASKFILSNSISIHIPVKGVCIQHGHQYERAHHFDQENAVIETLNGEKYFIPPWGSYYVTNVINKYKQERSFINAVRPIKHFIIHGIIFDTFFTLRFLLSNFYYFVMVRFWHFYMIKRSVRQVLGDLFRELELFQDYESLTREFFEDHQDTKVLIVGHTHNPTLRIFNDGTIFINTGTWTRMVNLDFGQWNNGNVLTYAKVLVKKKDFELEDFDKNVEVDLKHWMGINNLPYSEYH
ncbi:MAG TPA: metallophosphoesterase [Bacteriovoracaceae bacterium]|nr:metallophosphoesterase [Bacteriovoracaceae bacterium]